jgi:general secretion pathway protein N
MFGGGGLTLFILATFSGAATVTVEVLGQSDAKSDVAPTSFAVSRTEPDESHPAVQPRFGNPLWAIPIRELAATRDRPLFQATRRPPAPPVTATAAPSPPPPQPKAVERERPPLLLIGTVAGEIGAIALFLDQLTNRTIRLRTGQSLYGWVLGAVHKREVMLQKDQAIVLLPLSADAVTPVAAATPVSQVERERHGRR